MTTIRNIVVVCAICVGAALSGLTQNMPAVSPSPSYRGFSLPKIGGSLHYALSASGSESLGYNGANDDVFSTSLSGDLAYLSVSQSHPFSMIYAGGYVVGTSDQPSSSFHNLSLSQVLSSGRWSFVAADSVSYLPQTPAAGLSGVPGLGDLGVNPVGILPGAGQAVLTNYGTRVSNTVSGTVSRHITGLDTVSGSGSWSIQRFLGDSEAFGIDNNQASGSASFNRQIDRRSSLTAIYSYSKSSYPDSPTSFTSQAVNVEFSRQWTRKFSTDASIGPQRSSGGFDPIYNLAMNASLAYAGGGYVLSAAYVQSTNSGSGVTTGATSESASANISRRLGPVWNSAASFAFTRTNSLPVPGPMPFASKTLIASGQLSRQLGQNFSMYASYTAEHQVLGANSTQVDTFFGLTQIIGFGVTYAPRSIKFDR